MSHVGMLKMTWREMGIRRLKIVWCGVVLSVVLFLDELRHTLDYCNTLQDDQCSLAASS